MRHGDRGFALILVLIAAALVFALGMQSAQSLRAATVEARVMVERTRSLREARSAASLVLASLFKRPGERTGDSSGADGSDPSGGAGGEGDEDQQRELPEVVKEILRAVGRDIEEEAQQETQPDGSGVEGGGLMGRSSRRALSGSAQARLPRGEVLVRIADDGPVYRVRLTDGLSQLNFNMATADHLRRYFTIKGVTAEGVEPLVAQIIDWRDADDFVTPLGAERAEHALRGIVCRNRPFTSVEELLYLPAMTREIFDAIRAELTSFGDGTVHIGSAPRAVLASLPGMTPELADQLIRLRSEGPITEAALDRALPIAAREAKTHLRIETSSLLRIHVEVVGEASLVFEGLAVLGRRGEIADIGLRPIIRGK